jgi:hypothetical protein
MDLGILDAVMTGCAFEAATSAISVLEAGSGGPGKISTELLCTLDNFIQVLLFNERVLLTGCAHTDGNRISAGRAVYRGGAEGQKLIEAAGIFLPLQANFANVETLSNRIDTVLKPVENRKISWFVITCSYPEGKLTINQEMLGGDLYYIEDAIDQAGAEKFKPVFPGEHLYLGLRAHRLPLPRVTQTMSDQVGLRLRAAVREKMEKLNAFVSQGAPLVPELPPLYVSRILRDCTCGNDFIPVLLQIRNSPAMRRFREWLAKCAEQARSAELEEREKAVAAWEKFTGFPLELAVDRTAAGMSVLNAVIAVGKMDVMGVLAEVAGPIANFFLSAPFLGLRQFSGNKVEPAKLDAFLTDSFGDTFTRTEMNMISYHLKLPSNLKDWAAETAELTAGVGRIYPDEGPLARSYSMNIRDPDVLSEAVEDFKALQAKAQRVISPNGPA